MIFELVAGDFPMHHVCIPLAAPAVVAWFVRDRNSGSQPALFKQCEVCRLSARFYAALVTVDDQKVYAELLIIVLTHIISLVSYRSPSKLP